MAITINFQLIGVSQGTKESIQNALVQTFALLERRWHVQFIGSQTDDEWEMRVSGPGVETTEYLDGSLPAQTRVHRRGGASDYRGLHT